MLSGPSCTCSWLSQNTQKPLATGHLWPAPGAGEMQSGGTVLAVIVVTMRVVTVPVMTITLVTVILMTFLNVMSITVKKK